MTNYLEEYLNNNRVAHRWVHHRPAYSAQETAAAAHVSGKQFAKTVIVIAVPKNNVVNFWGI